jgi:hypothetical protein
MESSVVCRVVGGGGLGKGVGGSVGAWGGDWGF